MRHILIALALVITPAAPLAAQTSAPAEAAPVPLAVPVAPVAPPAPKPQLVHVALTTAEGVILLELEKTRAPLTTANFLRYVDQKRLDGAVFYRAMKSSDDGNYGLIQGGVRGDPKKVLPPVAHEPTSKTGLSHVDGAISMARLAPGSARVEFFIIIGGLTALDANPAQTGDNAGYAVFGRVAEGMDVVKKILLVPVSVGGTGPMKGQMIAAPVKILTARRAKAPVAPPPPQS